MQRVRLFVIMAMLTITLFIATNPVFAAGNGNNNNNGNGNKGPGNPVLPEAPYAVLLPLAGLLVIVLALFIVARRRQHMHRTTTQ
ncbi:MAG: hypothetical protein LC793_23745 [Thermomicrobia bacterium]|nr:hypothetical protein [Thermomicrobia bacterium]